MAMNLENSTGKSKSLNTLPNREDAIADISSISFASSSLFSVSQVESLGPLHSPSNISSSLRFDANDSCLLSGSKSGFSPAGDQDFAEGRNKEASTSTIIKNINFSQSSLITTNIHTSNFGGTDIGFLSSSQDKVSHIGANATITLTQDCADDVEISYEIDELQPILSIKEFKSTTGRILSLKTRKRKKTNVKSITKEAAYGINIDHLYNRLEISKLVSEDCESTPIISANTNKKSILLAEKWRPNKFIDLVGNEKTNRYILRWLRSWSKAVFGESIIDPDTNKSIIDPFERPDKKVLLIHGPPGIGKTTVAHVLAKQTGFDIMEVNASDERAGQKVKDKVHNSLTSVTFSGRPTCLIADEIDGGAESGFIKVLVDILNNDNKSLANHNKRTTNSNKTNKSKFLMRPIIAICNDLYSPVLEKLRPHAEIISFKKPADRTIKERLRTICTHEKLPLSAKEIQDIVELTNCDIRSCLNILQFGGSGDIHISQQAANSKKKDTALNWFTIVNQIFRRHPTDSKEEQFKSLFASIETNSNFEKIVNGCFNLYIDTPYQDDLFKKPSSISDWMFFNDMMASSVFELNSELVPYCSQVAMKFFSLFSEINKNTYKIRGDYEYFEKKKHNQESIIRVLNRLPVQTKHSLRTNDLSTQFLPYLSKILFPDLKSTKLSTKETDRNKIAYIAAIIKSFQFQIEQFKDENFQTVLTLFPSFDKLIIFDDSESKNLNIRRTALLPLIALEIEKSLVVKRPLDKMSDEAEKEESNKVPKKNSMIEFFKTKYDHNSIPKKKQKNDNSRIWVKYHEGFSNAVRKNISWDELWASV